MSETLSLAFLSHLASPGAPTGAERSLALLAEGMRRRGHRVAVVMPGQSALESSLRGADVELRRVPSRACWLAYHDPRPWPVALAKWIRGVWPQRASAELARLLDEWKPSVVHVNCLPHLIGAAAAARSGRPVVWHIREILPPGRRRRWLAAALRRRATALVAVSEAVGSWLRDEGLAERLHVVPNGVEIESDPGDPAAAREALGLPDNGPMIGLFGQLLPHKGALAFVEAARRALGRVPELRFVLAGAGPDGFRREVQKAIAETGRAERFHLLPPEPTAERLIRATDVVCLATTTPDPLPRVVLEAMAAGKPVAAFRSGGTPEMVRDQETGILVPTGDAVALGRAFARLAGDRALRGSMGTAGAQRAREHFSQALQLDRMEALFRSLAR